MRILLVQPAPFENGRIGLETALWLSEPAALTALAANLPPGHDVRILDLRLDPAERLLKELARYRPDVVGVSCMTTDAYEARAVAHAAKSVLGESVFTILGGHHPTLAPEDHDHPAVDALCIGEGEETFAELVNHLSSGGSRDQLDSIPGLAWFRQGELQRSLARPQTRRLDDFAAPRDDLIERYAERYFFAAAQPMASIQTSRGCAFDCNFCAIWEFYERKVRFLSAPAMVDRMEARKEPFVFFLDDNFLTHRPRLEQFLQELDRRRVRKYWMIQGRTDFIAEHPDLVRRMRDLGLMMVLSGYESNDEDTLAALRKDNSRSNNQRAAALLHQLGILSTGIFMVHPEWQPEQFERLYESINEMRITIPLVVIHTPLPGTQSYRERRADLLSTDARMFDLLHAVVPTALPRDQFYEQYARWNQATMPATRGSLRTLLRRPRLAAALIPGIPALRGRLRELRAVLEDPQSYLRSEAEILSHLASGRKERAA